MLLCPNVQIGAKRTTNVVAASSDYTCVFWVNPRTPVGGAGRTLWIAYDDEATYSQWIALYTNAPDDDVFLSIGTGGAQVDQTVAEPIQINGLSAIAYVRSGTTHTVVINGKVLAVTEDVSAYTLGEVWIGSDGYASSSGNTALQYFREWSSALTLAQVIAELNSPTPIVTANLQTNTPLATTYDDTTANNNDWTPVGASSFVSGPLPKALTNTTALLAHDLGVLGTEYVQVTRDSGGTTRTVWYTFTPPVDTSLVMSFFPLGQIGVYPLVFNIDSDTSGTEYRGYSSYPIKPTVIPVTAGVQMWFQVVATAGNPPAALWIRTQAWVQGSAPEGSLLINDAGTELPAALLDEATGEPLAYETLPGGEEMVQLLDGTLMLGAIVDNTVRFFTADYTEVLSIPSPSGASLASDRAGTFYLGTSTGDTIQTYSPLGVAGAAFGPVAVNLTVMWPSRDNTILYYASGTAGAALKRWNLVTNSALSDLAAGVPNYIIREIFTLADDSILVLYSQASVDIFVTRYDPAGATLNSYVAQFAGVSATDPHLALARDDPDSFWAWTKIPNSGLSRFQRIETATGAILIQYDLPNYTNGSYSPLPTTDPLSRFGHSESCTFVITGTPTPRPTPTPDTFETEIVPIRRLRRAPVIHNNDQWIFHTRFQLDLKTGIGLDGCALELGADPQVMLRWSNNGGKTWSNEHWVSAGKIGQYKRRANWRRLGRARNRVYEVVVSDPNAWQLIAAYLDVDGERPS